MFPFQNNVLEVRIRGDLQYITYPSGVRCIRPVAVGICSFPVKGMGSDTAAARGIYRVIQQLEGGRRRIACLVPVDPGACRGSQESGLTATLSPTRAALSVEAARLKLSENAQ